MRSIGQLAHDAYKIRFPLKSDAWKFGHNDVAVLHRYAVRKASGAKLGNPSNIWEAGAVGRSSLMEAADDQARSLLPLLRTLRAEGAITIGAITRSLNERRIPTARGSRGHVSSVANLLARAQKLEVLPRRVIGGK